MLKMETNEIELKNCDNCRYYALEGYKEPCKSCYVPCHSNWRPVISCWNCVFINTKSWDSPCNFCDKDTYSLWKESKCDEKIYEMMGLLGDSARTNPHSLKLVATLKKWLEEIRKAHWEDMKE